MVKTRFRIIRLMSHMPFPEKGCLISGMLKVLREINQVFRYREPGYRPPYVYVNTILSEWKRGSVNIRGGHKSILNMGTFHGHFVHARRLKPGHFACKSHKIIPVIIAQDKDHISWEPFSLSSSGRESSGEAFLSAVSSGRLTLRKEEIRIKNKLIL
jgi:hypothetical protein